MIKPFRSLSPGTLAAYWRESFLRTCGTEPGHRPVQQAREHDRGAVECDSSAIQQWLDAAAVALP